MLKNVGASPNNVLSTSFSVRVQSQLWKYVASSRNPEVAMARNLIFDYHLQRNLALWKVKCDDYKDRSKKVFAYNEIHWQFSETKAISFVEINSIRSITPTCRVRVHPTKVGFGATKNKRYNFYLF